MRHLIRTYTVWELIYQIWDRQTMLIKTKKKRKKMGAFKRCILLSLSVKRPLIFWTRRLHLDVLQSQCIHTCHTNGFIIRLPLLMIRVNRLFTAQRSVKCWFFDNVWIMTQLICAAVGCRYSAVSAIYMSNDRLEPFNYHNIAFKWCADVVSLGRLDRLWFFRHHWFVKIGWLGENGVQGTNLLDRFIRVLGCLKSVQNS